jgi:acetylornithine/succinyldiaminopimelate/putrescine aminotransferase
LHLACMNSSGNISQRSLFLRHVAQTSPFPPMLEVKEAYGCTIVDINDKSYLDFISGISVSNIGHRHPKVVKAIRDQADAYMHVMVYGEFIQGPQVKLAQLLSHVLPLGIDSVYFVNSGTEAVEGALKLAKRHTGRTELISFQNSYHGSTHGALSIMGSEVFKQAYRPLLPDTRLLRYNNFEDLNLITCRTACVVVEPFQGEAGAIEANPNWLLALRNKCSEQSCILIFDEIQSGFGRTGKFFGYQHYNINPDIILMAKGMGGGLPIGAFAASKALMSDLSHDPLLGHLTTFGGNALCCAAALAVTEVLLETDLIVRVDEKAARIRELLVHPDIMEIMNRCYELGLITDWFLFADDCLRLAPPLVITHDEIDQACQIILNAIQDTASA